MGMTKQEITRINELAKKSKSEGLSDVEKAEQQILREAYVKSYRENMRSVLDQTVLVRPDGTKSPLTPKKDPENRS